MLNLISQDSVNPVSVTGTVFKTVIPPLGEIQIRHFDIDSDIALLHRWVNQEYAKYWGMMGFSVERVRNEYETILRKSEVYAGLVDGEVGFFFERYRPCTDQIRHYYEAQNHDRGLHVLMGPPTTPRPKFSWHIFTTILRFFFSDPEAYRVVGEPDIRNHKLLALCYRAGFQNGDEVLLPCKTARLIFCTRERFLRAVSDSAP